MRNPLREAPGRLKRQYGDETFWREVNINGHLQGESKTIKIQDYPGTGNMLFRVAIPKGYCDRHGIKCELSTIPNASLGAQALLRVAGDRQGCHEQVRRT